MKIPLKKIVPMLGPNKFFSGPSYINTWLLLAQKTHSNLLIALPCTTLHMLCVMNYFRVLHSCNPSYTIVQNGRQLTSRQVVMLKHQSKLQELSLLSIWAKGHKRTFESSKWSRLLLDVCNNDAISNTIWWVTLWSKTWKDDSHWTKFQTKTNKEH